MASELVALLGDSLLTGGGEKKATTDLLAGKPACILYFSAHWCPPCRGFTPHLAEAYKEYVAKGGAEAEIVFVTWDNTAEAFSEYFASMPWSAVPYEGTDDLRTALNSKFSIQGIPALVALGPDGAELHSRESVDLRSLVQQHKAAAFPMTVPRVLELQREEVEMQSAMLKELAGSLFPPVRGPGSEAADVALGDLLGAHEHLMLLFSDGDGSDATYKAIPKIQARINESGKRLAVVYLAWTLYNDQSDHKPLAADHHALMEVPEELKAKLGKLSSGGIRAPHAVLLGKEADGAAKLVLDDPGAAKVQEFGAEGYPWSEEKLTELKAAAEARFAQLKEKQKNLEFLNGSTSEGLLTNGGEKMPVAKLTQGGSDAVVGIYFSAHWCPPCRGFTPVLAKCHQDLKAAGKSFEVVFVSSDRDEDSFKEYFAEMPWLAIPFAERDLAKDLNRVFEVGGIPTLVLLRPDGSLITAEGREAIQYGPDFFPWGPADMERGKAAATEKKERERKAALEAEAAAAEAQRAAGEPVVKRLRGQVGEAGVVFAAKEHTVTIGGFATIGAPDALAKSGVLYYEVELLSLDGIPQFGFASPDFEVGVDSYSGEGVGDDAESWGLDGARRLAWHDGSRSWDCGWSQGDVIGLAANIDAGKVAVSKNGSWTEASGGVVFQNDKIKAGVYPCLTAGGYKIRYNLDGATHGPFRHGPPPAEAWDGSAA